MANWGEMWRTFTGAVRKDVVDKWEKKFGPGAPTPTNIARNLGDRGKEYWRLDNIEYFPKNRVVSSLAMYPQVRQGIETGEYLIEEVEIPDRTMSVKAKVKQVFLKEAYRALRPEIRAIVEHEKSLPENQRTVFYLSEGGAAPVQNPKQRQTDLGGKLYVLIPAHYALPIPPAPGGPAP